MSSAILSTAGSFIGGAIGGPLGAAIGGAIGAAVGGAIDRQIFAPSVKGPRLDTAQITSSAEGAAINRLAGTMRCGGEMIWATRYRETKKTESSGGKGGPKSTTYAYACSFAVAFCEGSAATTLGRVWADGKVLDLSKFTYRFYPGSESQTPDSLIESIEGAANTPAYRGTAYLVFEYMPLGDFGNRIPQITAEITVPVERSDSAAAKIRGVTLIPATGSFAYAIEPFLNVSHPVETLNENVHMSSGRADVLESLDQLDAGLPNCDTVAIVVAWFGDDLRCATCDIKPRIALDPSLQDTAAWLPRDWEVAGLGAADVDTVSQTSGASAFGSTPDDQSVKDCINELRSRGKRIVFYPFILMDIPTGNALPDPYGGSEQAAYPWRGRITCTPAPSEVGTVDKTATAGTQVSAFFSGTWGYENFITHYANLCDDAGGVDVFLIGSELVGLTSVRSDASTYPFVADLVSLAATVKGILPTTDVSYAADWSEYHSHRPTDGSDDVYFNLDPLWSDANIDFIGIDAYFPLTDHRLDTAQSIYDTAYIQQGIEGGEYFDWYYASDADRVAGTRTTITDGAYDKPWVFRQKDMRNWWRSDHYDRPAGTEAGSPTDWVPGDKPIWFTEFGCPAVNRGTNQPNVFSDPKSSESAYPYFSTGARDDLIQRRFYDAVVDYWSANAYTFENSGGVADYNSLKTDLGHADGYFANLNSIKRDNGYVFYPARFTSSFNAQLSGEFNSAGQLVVTMSQTDRSGTYDIDEVLNIGAMAVGQYVVLNFVDAPSFYYYCRIKSLITRYVANYSGTAVSVLVFGADVVSLADDGAALGYMVEPANMIAWTWDARPYPVFPQLLSAWSDGANYQTGHWINGRIGASSGLGDLILKICARTIDTTLIDTSLVSGESVTGYLVSQLSSPRDDLAPLLSIYAVDAHESDGLIKFVSRKLAQTVNVSSEDLVATDENPTGYQISETQKYEIPANYSLTYINQENDYQTANVSGTIELGDTQSIATANWPIVMSEAEAKSRADTLVYSALMSRENLTTELPPSLSRMEPGDVLALDQHRPGFRINKASVGNSVQVDATACEPTIYELSIGSGSSGASSSASSAFGPVLVQFMDLPIIDETDPDPKSLKVAAAATPWSGGATIYRENASGGFDIVTTVSQTSVMGELTEALAAGTRFDWDYAGEVKVLLYSDDVLSSVDPADVAGDTNLIAIKSPSGLWELVGFATATLTGTREYTLTDLLRGSYGTENEMNDAPYPVGSQIVVVNLSNLAVVPISLDKRGVAQTYRYGPALYPQDHITFREDDITGYCIGLRPYAPVDEAATADMAGNLQLTWTRRTRFGNGTTPLPLNEQSEAYEIEIMTLDGLTVKRTVTGLGAPGWQYTITDQTTDFGATISISDLIYRVYQMSGTVGRGSAGYYP